MRCRNWPLLTLLATLVCLLCACADPPEYADEHLRIVSLSPAITQLLTELDLGEAVVAVGDGDELAPRGVPSLGRFNDLDLERLITLAPTHVLAMTGQSGLPPRVTAWGDAGRFSLSDMDYPADLASTLGLIRSLGDAIRRPGRTENLARRIESQLQAIADLARTRRRPRALLVFATDPVIVSGPGTVNDELLTIAGGQNAAAHAALTAVTYDREALRALAPEVVFLMSPGAEPLAGPNDPRLDAFRGLELPALRDGRIYLLNDPGVLLPGPSVATTAVSMAVALHPDLATPIAEAFRASP